MSKMMIRNMISLGAEFEREHDNQNALLVFQINFERMVKGSLKRTNGFNLSPI